MGHTNPWSLRRHQKKIPLTYHAQYIKSAGEVLWAANELQNEYKRFFGALVSQSNAMGEAIWDTLVSDQAQRDILRAIIPITLTIGIQKRVAKNLLWALSETKSVAGYRNIAAHMPVSQSFFKGENDSIPAFLARETAAHLEPIRKEVEWGESVVILYVAVIRDGDRRCGSPSIVEPPAAAGYVTTAT